MESKHYAIVVGARPNFIKAAPFIKELQSREGYTFDLIHTGQHYDKNMSESFFTALHIPKPHWTLTHQDLGGMIMELRTIFNTYHFHGVILFGDVQSTLAGAVAAVAEGIKVYHVESGLRSYDKRMPEETNRIVVDHLAHTLFTSEPAGQENLLKEGIHHEKIYHVGNIMIETLENSMENISNSTVVEDLRLTPKEYVVMTIHRQENLSETRLRKLVSLAQSINRHMKVILPLHPGTKAMLEKCNIPQGDLMATEPQGYFDFMKLVTDSKGVITDSGGIQEETTHLGIPCCTLRENTERPITLILGSNKLFPESEEDPEKILEHLGKTFPSRFVPFWDNNVTKRIFEIL